MKKHIFAACLAALTVTPAMAADMAVKAPPMGVARPIYDWTGMYVGINGGWAQSRNCWDMNGALVFNFTPALAEGCNTGNGGVIGGQIGYRYQTQQGLVFGLEAQGDWADIKGSNQSAIFNGINAAIAPNAINLTNTTKTDAIGMFKGQVGYSFGAVLWYVTGGAAVRHDVYDGALSVTGPNVPPNFPNPLLTDHASAIRFGEVVGTGVDVMFAPNWTAGIEYNHVFMKSQDVGFAFSNAALVQGANVGLLGPGAPSRHESISGDMDLVTARIGYKF